MRRLLALVMGLAGCDRVFALENLRLPADGAADDVDAMQCPYTGLDPGTDSDGDGMLNGVDACPLVPSAGPGDEDQDGTPDACDLCPQFAEPGADVECDGIGAACDPDNSVDHVMQFYGFGSGAGVTPDGATISGGLAQFVFQSGNIFRAVRAGAATTPDGMIEATFTIRGSNNVFAELSIGFSNPSNGNVVRIELENTTTDNIWRLLIVDRNTDQPGMLIGQLPADFQVRLRGTFMGTTVRGEVTGDAAGMVTHEIAPITGAVHLTAGAYRDDSTSTMNVDASYMLQIKPR